MPLCVPGCPRAFSSLPFPSVKVPFKADVVCQQPPGKRCFRFLSPWTRANASERVSTVLLGAAGAGGGSGAVGEPLAEPRERGVRLVLGRVW